MNTVSFLLRHKVVVLLSPIVIFSFFTIGLLVILGIDPALLAETALNAEYADVSTWAVDAMCTAFIWVLFSTAGTVILLVFMTTLDVDYLLADAD